MYLYSVVVRISFLFGRENTSGGRFTMHINNVSSSIRYLVHKCSLGALIVMSTR